MVSNSFATAWAGILAPRFFCRERSDLDGYDWPLEAEAKLTRWGSFGPDNMFYGMANILTWTITKPASLSYSSNLSLERTSYPACSNVP